jgi:hypothetical protein
MRKGKSGRQTDEGKGRVELYSRQQGHPDDGVVTNAGRGSGKWIGVCEPEAVLRRHVNIISCRLLVNRRVGLKTKPGMEARLSWITFWFAVAH